jgi:hypothetical protein
MPATSGDAALVPPMGNQPLSVYVVPFWLTCAPVT